MTHLDMSPLQLQAAQRAVAAAGAGEGGGERSYVVGDEEALPFAAGEAGPPLPPLPRNRPLAPPLSWRIPHPAGVHPPCGLWGLWDLQGFVGGDPGRAAGGAAERPMCCRASPRI